MGEASTAGESISVQKDEPVNDGLPWFADHGNLVVLVDWMESQGYGVSDVVEAVRKPWHYEDEFKAAQAARDPDREETDHG